MGEGLVENVIWRNGLAENVRIPSYMPAISSRLSILFINYISRDLDNIKLLLYNLLFRYLVVKPACINAA